jgi:hypothetical protein
MDLASEYPVKARGTDSAYLWRSGPHIIVQHFMTTTLKLEEEYRLIRAALVKAGVNMSDSIDALYRDWRRLRDRSQTRTAREGISADSADQWWAGHLAQFRRLIDAPHVAARAERARKDRVVDRPASNARREPRLDHPRTEGLK